MKGDKTTPTKLISRYIKAPIRVLCKARDLYVRSLTDCSGMISYDAAMGCPAGVAYTLPTSFVVNSSMSREEEDLRALMLALSQKSTHEVVEASTIKNSRSKGLFKSSSVGVIGRIDEDKPCNFSDDFKVIDSDKVLFARNRSCCAVSKKRQDWRKI